jgi:hypothetical protein
MNPISIAFLVLFCTCPPSLSPNPYPTVGAIPVPAGFHRLPAGRPSFAGWLRALPLKKDRRVHLYNGVLKAYQGAQFAVVDVSVGHSDLQQCADAVMRLRAEYCYANHDLSAIDFVSEQGTRFFFPEWARHRPDSTSRKSFDIYLDRVFMYCSTRSLEKQLVSKQLAAVEAGDVLIRGGAPGHAMIVIDVAEDSSGRRIFLLAQSYMPAQDIHIVIDPTDGGLSPWYSAGPIGNRIETPEWTFTTNQLRTWPGK